MTYNKSLPLAVEFNKPLQAALREKDVIRARAAIITHIDTDAARQNPMALRIADIVEKEFSSVGKHLYEEDDGRIQIPETDKWDLGLWNKIKASLRINFSREKVEFATNITLKLIEKRHPTLSQHTPDHEFVGATSSPRGYGHQPTSNQRGSRIHTSSPRRTRITVERSRSSSQQTAVVGAVIVGAVVGGVVGAVVGATVTGVVIGGAVVGGVTYYNKKS